MKYIKSFALCVVLLLTLMPATTHAQPAARLVTTLLKQGASKAGTLLRTSATKPTVWKMPTLRTPVVATTPSWLKRTATPSTSWKMPISQPSLASMGAGRLHATPLPEAVAPATQRIAHPGLSGMPAAQRARQASAPVYRPLAAAPRNTGYRIPPEAKQIGVKAIKAAGKGYVKSKREEEQRKRRQQ